tara:strand:- start:391 stop:624 length:234 start_codon:yes stop_codon:yes gene_type:complete
MSGVPYLPNEIVTKINNMAYEMHRLDMIQLNQEILKNNINKLIEYTNEDYEDEKFNFGYEYESYGEYMFQNYGYEYE